MCMPVWSSSMCLDGEAPSRTEEERESMAARVPPGERGEEERESTKMAACVIPGKTPRAERERA